MKLSHKLGVAFTALVVLTVMVGAFAMTRLARLNANTEDIATSWLPSVQSIADIRGTLNQFRRAEADHVMALELKECDEIEKRLAGLKQALGKQFELYQPLISSSRERVLFDALRTVAERYFAVHARLIPLSRGGAQMADAAKDLYRGESRATFGAVTDALAELVQLNADGAKKAAAEAASTYLNATQVMIGLIALAATLASALGWLIVRDVRGTLGGDPAEAAAVARRVAEGDLSVDIALAAGDQRSLLSTLRQMQASLSRIVAEVRGNATGVAAASTQIAQGNSDLSSRTEEQASALQQTAASMEQLSSTVRQNADNARHADQLARSASSVAADGSVVVGEVVATMKEIGDASRRIGDIIGVIDGISLQTNILALNAAVEAARAGEQGRGFAVVAGEVRTLAQRSAEAAKEIKSLITANAERVDRGAGQVTQAGQKMNELVEAVSRVSGLMGEISAASQEQSAGVGQIETAVTQMDQATQQNAALVEESAAAAESLKAQAGHLVDTVAVFRLAA
jgi:methyl-accepting chemotaxis protein